MNKLVDDKLLSMLDVMIIGSRIRTCLNIRLADYASQLLGYRSTRHVRVDDRDNVEDVFLELTNLLIATIYECIDSIHHPHVYKSEILDLDDLSFELKLEDVLFECVTLEDPNIFVETFFE